MKKKFLIFLFLSTSFLSLGIDFNVKSEAAVLIDQKAGRVFFGKNADKPMPIASITKVMSLLVTLEAIEEQKIGLDTNITISKYAAGMGGSQIWLAPNEKMSVRDLLKAVSVVSANDAVVALAEATYGSEEIFLNKMNDKAGELGLKNTIFFNSNGLPEAKDNYSTAREIAIISRELIAKYPFVLENTSIWVDYLRDGESFLRNTNELVSTTDYIDGLKTGFTNEAGFCIASTGSKNGNRFIAVILNAPRSDIRFKEAKKLIDYGIYNVRYVNIVKKDQEVGKLKVLKGKESEVEVLAGDSLVVPLLYGEKDKLTTEKEIKTDIEAPIKKGEVLGFVSIYNGKEKMGTVEITAKDNIEKANVFILLFRYTMNFFKNLV
ncbi:MAG: D-alanyl-D-alanine carboxypeptidase family protein [Fusobacteriota bacterium]